MNYLTYIYQIKYVPNHGTHIHHSLVVQKSIWSLRLKYAFWGALNQKIWFLQYVCMYVASSSVQAVQPILTKFTPNMYFGHI